MFIYFLLDEQGFCPSAAGSIVNTLPRHTHIGKHTLTSNSVIEQIDLISD